MSIAPVHPLACVATPAGQLQLVPVDPANDEDVELIHAWMHKRHVECFWKTALSLSGIADYLAMHSESRHLRSFFGDVDGERVAYFELYRADQDPLAEHYAARPYDLGFHFLIGPAERTGRGLGRALIAGVRDALLAGHPKTTRVVAEPDIRNAAVLRALAAAGFAQLARLSLPDKTAVLVTYERTSPHDER